MAVCPKCGRDVELEQGPCVCGAGIAQFGEFDPYSPSPSVLGLDESQVRLLPREQVSYGIELSFAGVLRATFDLWIRAFGPAVMALFFPLFVGMTVVSLPAYLRRLGLAVDPLPEMLRLTVVYLFFSLAHVSATAVLNEVALYGSVRESYLNIFHQGLRYWWRSFALYLLFALVTTAVSSLVLSGSFVAIVGVLVALSAAYYFARWMIVVPIVVVENARLSTAVRRSTELAKGHSWKIFGLIVVVALIVFIPLKLINWGIGQLAIWAPIDPVLASSGLIFLRALLEATLVSLAFALCLAVYGALRDGRPEPLLVTLASLQTRVVAWSLAEYLHERGIAAQIVERQASALPLVFFAQPFDVKVLMADRDRADLLAELWRVTAAAPITE